MTTPTVDHTAQLSAATHNSKLLRAALALHQERLSEAEPLLKTYLSENPFDVAAIRMLAELAARIGRTSDSEILLRRALELAPNFGIARVNLATILYKSNRATEALAELEQIQVEQGNGSANLRAAVLNRLGEFEQAMLIYADTLNSRPNQPYVWMSYGHVLKTVGRLEDGVAAYRRAISLQPRLGEAWWSLANLKTVKFDAGDLDIMECQLADTEIGADDRFHLEFALGKAYEDAGEPAHAFALYQDANVHRRALIEYDREDTRTRVDNMITCFTPEFLRASGQHGCPSSDPIFIVGMPRAGSTLVEQILASHSQVEAIAELPDIPQLWGKLGDNPFEVIKSLDRDQIRAIGEDYLARVLPQRRTDRPYFIDKLPNNWMMVGFIKCILPNARIIDARRHPLSCGFSNFKQHFARGQNFAYDLRDIGHYYQDYVRLMAHFDAALPGSVHRVIYEQMVDDSEVKIRALLSALELPFEAECLHFYRNERAVRTPSSEQVRSPIYRSGTEDWQAFAHWLGPLREALGSVVDTYSQVTAV